MQKGQKGIHPLGQQPNSSQSPVSFAILYPRIDFSPNVITNSNIAELGKTPFFLPTKPFTLQNFIFWAICSKLGLKITTLSHGFWFYTLEINTHTHIKEKQNQVMNSQFMQKHKAAETETSKSNSLKTQKFEEHYHATAESREKISQKKPTLKTVVFFLKMKTPHFSTGSRILPRKRLLPNSHTFSHTGIS